MPTPGMSTTRGPAGSMRELPRLVVQVALVVAAIPVRVLLDAATERGTRAPSAPSVRRIEIDDERPVLRVDQVIRAGRADLAHLGRAVGRRERDRLGALVDLEHEPLGVGQERAAERGERLRQEGMCSSLPELRDLSAPQPEPSARCCSIARAARETNSIVAS